jgi:O-antigen ligase
MLGLDCMVFGLGYAWCVIRAWVDRKRRGRTQELLVNGALFGMAVWLLVVGSMMTCLVCLLLGTAMIAATNRFKLARKPWLIHCFFSGVVGVAVAAVFFNVGLVEKLGRDPTLTGRTEIWREVLELAPNHYIGAGFESFWLGKRLAIIWSHHWWHPNEAHDGYLEVYLNLGYCGVALLALLLWTGYRNALHRLRRDTEIGSIALAYIFMITIYALTEAAFRMMDPIWVLFLWSITVAPVAIMKPARRRVQNAAVAEGSSLTVCGAGGEGFGPGSGSEETLTGNSLRNKTSLLKEIV